MPRPCLNARFYLVLTLLSYACAGEPRGAVSPTSPSGIAVPPPTLNWDCGRQAANATVNGWSFELPPSSCRSMTRLLDTGAGLVSVAPGNFRATVTGAVVQLDWDRVPDPVISHQIEAGSAPGLANLAVFNTGSAANSLSVADVPPGLYYVRVRAVGPDNQPGPSVERNRRARGLLH